MPGLGRVETAAVGLPRSRAGVNWKSQSGQLRPSNLKKPWSFERQAHSETCRTIYFGRSASAVSGLLGEVGQQSAGHLPLEHHGMANGGFSILPTGTTDTEPTYELRQSGRAALLYKIFCC